MFPVWLCGERFNTYRDQYVPQDHNAKSIRGDRLKQGWDLGGGAGQFCNTEGRARRNGLFDYKAPATNGITGSASLR